MGAVVLSGVSTYTHYESIRYVANITSSRYHKTEAASDKEENRSVGTLLSEKNA